MRSEVGSRRSEVGGQKSEVGATARFDLLLATCHLIILYRHGRAEMGGGMLYENWTLARIGI